MKLGRLFWKFFFFFWLAQLATTLGVGVTIWAHRHQYPYDHPPPMSFHELGPQSGGRVAPYPNRPPPPPPNGILPPLMPLVAGSFVSLVFAWLLAWYFAKPIRTLRRAFEAEANGDLDTRVGTAMKQRRDELSDLGSDFDRMAERLQNLVEGQRRLLHDVSHELRSPLARLQAATDLLRQQPERAQEFIDRIQRDTSRIDSLVGELLTLSRLDAGTEKLLSERFQLADLLEDVAEDARFEAAAKDCCIVVEPMDAITAVGDIELLRRALENVVRNAVRHAPVKSVVAIAGGKEASGIAIRVRDAGSGVDASDLEAIFEPFYRSANARPFEGYGLGLAISRQVMRSHGGTVSAENPPEGGFVVTLRMPLSPHSADG